MGLLEEIERALAERSLHPGDVELCATTLLQEIYPGLAPIAGGTDFGRDGDISRSKKGAPFRPRTRDRARRVLGDHQLLFAGGCSDLIPE